MRGEEYNNYTRTVDGPIAKKGKHTCKVAQASLEAAVGLADDVGVALCRDRWRRTDRSLKFLKQC